jgi:type 2 lantibiotic biosynthesis protein LanM
MDHQQSPVELGESFARAASRPPAIGPERFPEHPLAGALAIVEPLVHRGLEDLRQGVQTLAARGCELPFEPTMVEDRALADLLPTLIGLLGRPVVLELHVARLQDRLHGSTAEERFREFVEHMSDPSVAMGLLREYPVLAQQVWLCIDYWVAATVEFLQRLCDDWDAIRATFCSGGSPGALVGMDMGSGDKHRQGRSVIVATFRSGLSLVYKPRSLAVDVHFQELLQWVNRRGGHPPFRTLAILDRGSYGWIEFVRDESCTSSEGVGRFYRRQGGYLAILYAPCSTDFHYENLFAAGEHPVLVDLEALFHPQTDDLDPGADATLEASVLGIGLLPRRILPDGKAEGVDLSPTSVSSAGRWRGAGGLSRSA